MTETELMAEASSLCCLLRHEIILLLHSLHYDLIFFRKSFTRFWTVLGQLIKNALIS